MNEKGFIMPLMLGLALIFSSLLLTLAGRLESQAFSYGRRQAYLSLALMEMETIHRIHDLQETGAAYDENLLYLESGTPVSLTMEEIEDIMKITYRISYHNYFVSGALSWALPGEAESLLEEAASPYPEKYGKGLAASEISDGAPYEPDEEHYLFVTDGVEGLENPVTYP
ncbi:MAG: hypothetical protein FWF59_05685 [Turicibacter sp.]|nr:hypothetical protein [Turicibacter sp.]